MYNRIKLSLALLILLVLSLAACGGEVTPTTAPAPTNPPPTTPTLIPVVTTVAPVPATTVLTITTPTPASSLILIAPTPTTAAATLAPPVTTVAPPINAGQPITLSGVSEFTVEQAYYSDLTKQFPGVNDLNGKVLLSDSEPNQVADIGDKAFTGSGYSVVVPGQNDSGKTKDFIRVLYTRTGAPDIQLTVVAATKDPAEIVRNLNLTSFSPAAIQKLTEAIKGKKSILTITTGTGLQKALLNNPNIPLNPIDPVTTTIAGAGGDGLTVKVPDNLKPSQGEIPVIRATAKGVQIYTCKAVANDVNKFEWSFKAPEADLFNKRDEKIAKHYAGPTWEAPDGSKVIGEVREQASSLDSNAISWLLLKTKATEGNGIFGKITSIQRLDTVGGKAPADGCDQARANTELRVPYTATYYFYVVAP